MSTADSHVEHPAEAGAGAAVSRPRISSTSSAQAVQVVGVVPGQGGGDRLEPGEVGLVGVRLAQARARPSSVCTSTMARSAQGWWTPTTLSSGGSPNATGVTSTRRDARAGHGARLHGEHRHVELEQDAAARRCP